jgi:hypothetical protein
MMWIQAIVVRSQASHRTDDAISRMERPRLPRNKPATSLRNGHFKGAKTSTAVNPTWNAVKVPSFPKPIEPK